MKAQPPELIAINHDDYAAKYIGHLANGDQFFLTTPFVPASGKKPGREFVALFIFDSLGNFASAEIDDLGTRAAVAKSDVGRKTFEKRLTSLGQVRYGRIEVRPFQIERFGVTFGLIARPPEDEDDGWWVELHPGNYMAFHEPWDSGDYDT